MSYRWLVVGASLVNFAVGAGCADPADPSATNIQALSDSDSRACHGDDCNRSYSVVETGEVEVVNLVAVPLANVSRLVPSEYHITGADTGSATLVVIERSVRGLAINGRRAAAAIVSEVSIEVDAPDGSADIHAYLLWQVSNSLDLAVHLQSVGGPGFFSLHPEYNVPPADAAGNLNITGRVPWFVSPYSLAAQVPDVPATPATTGDKGITYHFNGPFGNVTTGFVCIACSAQTFGSGSVGAAAHTPLATIMGATTSDAFVSLFSRDDASAQTTLTRR